MRCTPEEVEQKILNIRFHTVVCMLSELESNRLFEVIQRRWADTQQREKEVEQRLAKDGASLWELPPEAQKDFLHDQAYGFYDFLDGIHEYVATVKSNFPLPQYPALDGIWKAAKEHHDRVIAVRLKAGEAEMVTWMAEEPGR